ncbi:MAG: hypothetical protein AAGA77_09285 [Bacteroidota bacterium]
MKTTLQFTLLLFLIVSCHHITVSKEEKAAVKLEVENILSKADQQAYLEYLFNEDQRLRQGQSADLTIKYGFSSKEHKEFIRKQQKLDVINFMRVEAYLEKFGYPKKDDFSTLANTAIWAVVEHSISYKSMKRVFPILYKAYQEGDMEASGLEWLLQSMHELKYGNKADRDSSQPYRAEEEIERLINKLKL